MRDTHRQGTLEEVRRPQMRLWQRPACWYRESGDMKLSRRLSRHVVASTYLFFKPTLEAGGIMSRESASESNIEMVARSVIENNEESLEKWRAVHALVYHNSMTRSLIEKAGFCACIARAEA